jgi:hypothetical protein
MKNDGFEKGLTWIWRGSVVVLLMIVIFRQSEILDGQPVSIPTSNASGQLGSLGASVSKLTREVEGLKRDIGTVKDAVEGGSREENRTLSNLAVKIDQSTLEIERLGRQVSNLD